MSKLTWIIGFITLIVLLVSPGGFFGGSLQLVLVVATAISALRDAGGTDE